MCRAPYHAAEAYISRLIAKGYKVAIFYKRVEDLALAKRLVDAQNAISAQKHAAYIGKTLRCLVDGFCEEEGFALTARTPGNRLVRIEKGEESLIGTFQEVTVTGANTWSLWGTLKEPR